MMVFHLCFPKFAEAVSLLYPAQPEYKSFYFHDAFPTKYLHHCGRSLHLLSEAPQLVRGSGVAANGPGMW